jgi:hypothetical protein
MTTDEGTAFTFSRDGGATWSHLEPCGSQCYAGLYGDYFYYLGGPAEHKTTLQRAAFGTTTWEELSLPVSSGPERGYRSEFFVLDDGTLVIEEASGLPGTSTTSDGCVEGAVGHYRISRDHGDTWSERRALPGSSNCIIGTRRNTVYAQCGTIGCYEDTGGGYGSEGTYQSTDLVHWEALQHEVPYDVRFHDRGGACPPSRGQDPVYNWVEEPPLQIGEEIFKLFHVRNTHGREHVLMVSRDDCRTWKRVLR